MSRIPQKLPAAICFRITRNCNARCRFCLAPPDGRQPDEAVLRHRLDWLIERGVRSIQFCGGEPTTHPALPQLLMHAQTRGAKSSLCTNALAISDSLLPLLRTTGTCVRVSLHGDRSHHDSLVGPGCFDRTTNNLRRLLAAGVATSLQTTVVAGGDWVVDWAIGFCLQLGVRRLGILPFLPRGEGGKMDEFRLTGNQRAALRAAVGQRRRELIGRLDLRWLDFSAGSLPVVEPDGRFLLEGASEATDRLLFRIPDGDKGDFGKK